MKTKKFVSLLLTLCMLLSIVPAMGITASAYSAGDKCPYCEYGHFQWVVADDLHMLQCDFCMQFPESHYSGECNYCPLCYPTSTITNNTPQSAAATNHGYITVDGSAKTNTTVTVEVTPSEGYELDTLTYTPDGENAIDITAAKSFTMPAKAVTVSATFKHLPVAYLVPTYNKTDGTFYENASSGIKYWETGLTSDYTAYAAASMPSTLGTSNTTSWYYVTGTGTHSGTITVQGDVHLILADGCELTVKASGTNAGINVTGSNSLTVYAQSTGKSMGTLTACCDTTSENGGAGIGGNYGQSGNNITINGGTVTAYSRGTTKGNGAGIGGGRGGAGYNITINGGTVEAYSRQSSSSSADNAANSAGIGGGRAGKGYYITINGGTVTAYCSANKKADGSGIGAGWNADGHDITINGGTVEAHCNSGVDDYRRGRAFKSYEGSVSKIYVNTKCIVKTGSTSASSTASNTGGDMASTLSARYAEITPRPVTGITLSLSQLEIIAGKTASLAASVSPTNAYDTTVTWSSNSESVATVDENGVVTAVAVGTANITATANDGSGISASCTVTVAPKPKYAISVANDIANGTVTVDPTTAAENDTVTVTVTPSENYELKALIVSDGTNEITTSAAANAGEYAFTMPASAVTVSATFSKVIKTENNVSATDNVTIPNDTKSVIQNFIDNEKSSLTADTTYNFAVNAIEAQNVNTTAKDDIEAFAKAGAYTDATYYDVQFTRTPKDGSAENISDIGDYVFSFTINYSMVGKQDLAVYRYHDDKTEALTLVTSDKDANYGKDKTYIVEGTGADTKITIFASKFSLYVPIATVTPDTVKNAGYYATLTLNENIDINFVMDSLSNGFDIENLSVTVNDSAISLGLNSSNEVVGVLKAVSPTQMSESLNVVVTYDGVKVKSFTYSIRKYCDTVFKNYEETDKLYLLCEAVLNYGKYAEDYVNGNTASTLNSGHVTNFNDVTIEKPGEAKSDSGAEASLILDTAVTLKFTLPKDTTVSKADLIILNNLDPQEMVNPENIEVDGNVITVNKIGASKLSRAYTLIVDEDTIIENFGVYSYCYAVSNHDTDDTYTDTLKTLCKAIYAYGEAAKAYAN